jgi:uncharacterized membrane protein (UPF0127 family)
MMVLKNLTKNTVVSNDLKGASSFSDQVLGLLNPANPRSLLFRTRFGIHTFGLKDPIDVLILDSSWKVVKTSVSLKPNRVFLWNPLFPIVIELPENSITNSKTATGDILATKLVFIN